jgi:transposase-like protein
MPGHLEDLYGTEVSPTLISTIGAKFWLSVCTAWKNRGVTDGFLACVDGLKGLPEALEAVVPQTQGQLCIVHKARNSLQYVP